MRRVQISTILLSALILLCSSPTLLGAQEAPAAFILPAGRSIVVVLGDTPRLMDSFRVYRQDAGDRDFRLLTPESIRPIADPYRAAEVMGSDFRWVGRKIGSLDPPLVWRKLRTDRDEALALCLVSHGLRKAMGRTFIDEAVVRGSTYRYRVELLDMYGQTIERIESRVRAGEPQTPEAARNLEAEAEDGQITLGWDYPAYRNRADDLTVGFRIYRREAEAEPTLLTLTPVLRIEGWLSYVDTEAENGRTYTYLLEAVDLIGAVSRRIASAPVTPRDTRPPLVPTGLRAVDSEEGVLLLWRLSPDMDLAAYNVLRSDRVEGQYSRINSEPLDPHRARYLDRNIVRGTSYYYRITALDETGNESEPCGPTSIRPADSEPPPEVVGLVAEVDETRHRVTLRWLQMEIPDLRGYFVYRASSDRDGVEGKAIRLTADPLERSDSPRFDDGGYRDRGLAPGARLRYGVSAVDSSFNEGPMVFVEVTVPDNEPPKAPLAISARSTEEGSVRLRWQTGLDRDLASHRIYRKADRSFEPVAELERTQTAWIDSDVQAGRAYRYRITAVDMAGNESEPSREAEVVPSDTLAPEPPQALRIDQQRRGYRLQWQASPSSDTVGYRLYRAEYAGAPWQSLSRETIGGLSYNDRGGRALALYGITAVDSSGNESVMATIAAPSPEESR